MGTWDDIAASGRRPADLADALIADQRADIASLNAERERLEAQLNGAHGENERLRGQVKGLEERIAALMTANLKPGLRGLITTDPDYLDSIPYAEFGSVKMRWHNIETSPGVYDFAAIDAMFAAHPDVKFRVRFMAGIHAPQWVKDRSGGAVQHEPDGPNGGSGMVPRYWTDAYFADYMALMQAVAARYEAHPQFVEVPNSMTTTVYAEPFILAANAATIDRYWQAGLTKDKHEHYLRESVAAMMDLFPTTRVSLAGHSKWQYIVQGSGGPADGQLQTSWPAERDLLTELSATYGAHLVLEDHGLGPDDTPCPDGQPRETATGWYCYMAGLRDTEQTYGWQFTLNKGSMPVAADMGVAMGACFLEYAAFQALDPVKRREVHDDLLVNAAEKP